MWFQWLLIGLFAANIVVHAATVGQPRQPRKASEAAWEAVIYLLLIWGVAVYF